MWKSIALALTLTACATPDAKLYPIGQGQQVDGNEAFVTISNVWTEADALPLAEAHCAEYGRIAKFDQINRYRASFECVP